MNFKQINEVVTISEGNQKLGKIPSVSQPPIISCPAGVPCAKKIDGARPGCYVMHTYNIRPSVQKAYFKNWATFNADSRLFFDAVNNWVYRRRPSFFRWHVSGDIANQLYFDGMNFN